MSEKIVSQPDRAKSPSPIVNWLLIAAVVLFAALPFALIRGSEFSGSDDAATAAIVEIAPGTQPWFSPLWSPPGGEIESLLFAVQASLGAGAIGYYFGLKRGERQGPRRDA